MKRNVLLGVMVVTIVGLTVVGTTSKVHAASPFDGLSTFVERIAQKFGLKQADVQQVVDEVQAERMKGRQGEMDELLEARLNVAVKNKKITEAQKNLILEKHKELQAKRLSDWESWKDLTPEQRQTQRETQRTELEEWAKKNNIDASYLGGFGMGMGGRGKGMGWKMR